MGLIFDHNVHVPQRTLVWSGDAEQRLWASFRTGGEPLDFINNPGIVDKLTFALCRISDGKWAHKLSNGEQGWVAHYQEIVHPDPVIFASTDALDQNGQPSGLGNGLVYMPFTFDGAGLSYEECRGGFLMYVVDTGLAGGNNRNEFVVYLNVEQPWEEKRIRHDTVGTFGEGVQLADNAISQATFAANAINAAAIANGAIDEATFADDAVSARVIADDAIDASAIAADAIGAIEFADLASEEIADKVWNRAADTFESDSNTGASMGQRFAGMSRSILRWDDPAYTGQADARTTIVVGTANAAGRFYGADVPDDITENGKWSGSKVVVWEAVSKTTTACSIVALLNDGANNYLQLRRNSNGSTDIDLAVGDRLYFNSLAGLGISDVFDEPLYPNHAVAGTLGGSILQMLGLRQHNMQIKYTAWNAAGTPSEGTIYIYASKADVDGDPNITGNNAIGKYVFTGTFDPNTLEPLKYTSTNDPNI